MRKLIVLAVTAALALAGCGPAVEQGLPSTTWRQWNHLTSDAEVAAQAPLADVVTLNAYDYAAVPKVRAANPRARVYVYKDLTSTRTFECHGGVDDVNRATGVGYCDADANHPDWFLLDGSGSRLTYDGFPGHVQMDPGVAAYQDEWAADAVANAQALGFDGIWADNALVHCGTYHGGVCPSPTYPTDASIQAAYESMLDNVAAKAKAAGLLFSANESDSRLFPGLWERYAQEASGAYDEHWVEVAPGNFLTGAAWKTDADEVGAMEAAGKTSFVRAQTGGVSDVAGARYTYATWLLENGGHSSYDEGDDMSWRTARPWLGWDLGVAAGPYHSVGATDVYTRDFDKGHVFVNASATLTFGPHNITCTCVDEAGNPVDTITLGPHSAAILRTG